MQMPLPPASVLVICTRRIGDVLLTTPLIRSIKRAWPQVPIDALVFAGTQEVLKHNPDIRHILTVPERPAFLAHVWFAMRLYRRYGLAISTLTGDRPTLYAWLAGRYRIGLCDPARQSRLKQWMLHASLPFDHLNLHTVRMNLQLSEILGVPPLAEVVVSAAEKAPPALIGVDLGEAPYVVFHPFPKYIYKQWHEDGWVAVARWLANCGVRVVLTGGAADNEKAYVSHLALKMPPQTINLCGQISLSDTAAVIKGALAYVGPDTATTHIAAALGKPTVALFGPTNPIKWGPWPCGWPANQNPYSLRGIQQRGNVTLLQGNGDCVPCMQEGCQRHIRSSSDCLTHLASWQVINALNTQLKLSDWQPSRII